MSVNAWYDFVQGQKTITYGDNIFDFEFFIVYEFVCEHVGVCAPCTVSVCMCVLPINSWHSQ